LRVRRKTLVNMICDLAVELILDDTASWKQSHKRRHQKYKKAIKILQKERAP